MVVGAPYEGRERLLLSDLEYGAIYIFSRSGSTWTEDVKIRASNAGDGDLFGFSVSMSGDGNTLVSGASGESNSAGAAYVFTRSGSTWAEFNLMKAKNPANNDEFGFSVSLSDDAGTMVVGAPGEDSNYSGISNDGTGEGDNSNSRAGAVYIY